MATIRQKKLAQAIVENAKSSKPRNKMELVASVGYSTKSSKHKQKEIIQSKGVLNELFLMGFSEDKAKETVGRIVQFGNSDEVQLSAAKEIFKVHGSYAPDKHEHFGVSIQISAPIAKKYGIESSTGENSGGSSPI